MCLGSQQGFAASLTDAVLLMAAGVQLLCYLWHLCGRQQDHCGPEAGLQRGHQRGLGGLLGAAAAVAIAGMFVLLVCLPAQSSFVCHYAARISGSHRLLGMHLFFGGPLDNTYSACSLLSACHVLCLFDALLVAGRVGGAIPALITTLASLGSGRWLAGKAVIQCCGAGRYISSSISSSIRLAGCVWQQSSI